jgi:oxygen-dependent protoporphyrinogen oxidase
LLAPVDAAVGSALREIPYSSAATVSLAFDNEDVGFDLNAFGVLCPMAEKRVLLAATYSSTKWRGRAPDGKVLLRGFLGGPHNQAIMQRTDDDLTQIVISEMRSILGLKADPAFVRVFRWPDAMPQYTVGHLGRVALVDRTMAATPGLAVAGGAYSGVGVPNCIETGEKAASKVLGDLGMVLEEDLGEPEKRAY